MASYTTAELLKAVQEGNQELLPTLPVRRVHFKGPLGMLIAGLDDARTCNGGIGQSVYVMPSAQESRHVAEYIYGDAKVRWEDDRIDYQKHSGSEQGREVFGGFPTAKEMHGKWLLKVWEKSTGLHTPSLSDDCSEGDSRNVDDEGSSDSTPLVASRLSVTKRKAAVVADTGRTDSKRQKSSTVVAGVVKAEEATWSTVSADVHRVAKAKKAESLTEMEGIVRKRMEIDLQKIKVRRALLELEYQG
ncbi:hypothetical protein LTR56_007647 [Elasticomyces elasticus]|nr:hypothetical protein LTR56_007647 [Elasticomyces elasticus]KAK3665348.1 hypothetical protein LTR22_003870 [Elasticomyces elasticus]KAK4929679.1 hypothetical protein LTR49_003637 [Elasticomyces elasticus]KAK5761101.1 hypothetical protein LTS12_008778 [Elasticomyces elasticus]